jgi:hypothetical protein
MAFSSKQKRQECHDSDQHNDKQGRSATLAYREGHGSPLMRELESAINRKGFSVQSAPILRKAGEIPLRSRSGV